MNIPSMLIMHMKKIYGEPGLHWLRELPNLIHQVQRLWSLTQITPFPNAQYNFVASAWSAQYTSHVVIKCTLSHSDYEYEKKALLYFDGNGCVELLDFNDQYRCLLIQAIEPGSSLISYFPQQEIFALECQAQLITKLHIKPIEKRIASSFPVIEQWLATLYTSADELFSDRTLKLARTLCKTLIRNQCETYLLHGDLHHDNILYSHTNTWVAIDPKGICGELAYEIATCIRSPLSKLILEKDIQSILEYRFKYFSTAFNLEKQLLIEWSYVQAVLAACWALEDNLDSRKDFITLIEQLKNFL